MPTEPEAAHESTPIPALNGEALEGVDLRGNDDESTRRPAGGTTDWSVPTWVRHPRLEGVLGVRLADIDWGHIDGLVARKVAEDLSIEFKRRHYVLDRAIGRVVLPTAGREATNDRITKDRFELAKDVTAFANAAGGLIVIGVADSNGRAERIAEVDLKDEQRLAYFDSLRNWTAPYLSGVEIGHVASSTHPDRGCVLIYIPPSADGPHAVVEPNSHRYSWYVRDGGHARSLSEAQVAVAYRNRYAGRADIERRAHTVFGQGVNDLDRQNRVWLAAAVVPTKSAERRHLDRHLLEEYKAQTQARQDNLPGPWLGHHALFGRGRVVLRDSGASVALATDHLLHMYVDGSAFAAVALDKLENTEPIREHRPDLAWDVRCIRVGSITTWALALTGITCGHAVDAGSSGDMELVCGIITATQEDPDIFSPETQLPPLQHAVLDQPWRSSPREDLIPGTTWRDTVSPVEVTVSSVTANDTRELVAVAAQLVNELVAEFGGLPSDSLLTADGLVIGSHCYGSRLEPLRGWASQQGVLEEEQA